MNPFLAACTVTVVLAVSLAPPADAFRKGSDTKGCLECHRLTKVEAGKLLGNVVDNVVDIAPGPFPGVWEVDVARNGKTYPLYVDYSRKFLFNGQFIRLSDMSNITGRRFTDLNRVDVSSIPVQDAIRIGSETAKKKAIVLSDPTCPYCVKLHGEIKKAAAKDADVAFLVMPYPRNPNDKATYGTCLSVVCSKSVKLLDDAYAGKTVPAAACKSDAVDRTIRLANRLQVQGTPSMVLPDGRLISGYMEADALLSLLRGDK